ncbi:MAG: DUF418 domain-containing protein [Terrimonas sp.]|nr:DUF418 domain-containing protein [Terrimonas sp.]
MQALAPVQNKEREIFMDVLRGFAILGIFIANLGSGFSFYNESAGLTGPFLVPVYDHKMNFLHHMFIEGKFYSIFSLLFGWGVALQIKRAAALNVNAVPLLKRRLFFMLLLGFLHLLIWTGDIVFFYAILGFFLLLFRKLSSKTLLITGIMLILSPILLYWLKMIWPVMNYPAEFLLKLGIKADDALIGLKSEEEFLNLMRHGNWWDELKINITGIFFRYQYLFFVSRVPKVLGMFLIGFVVGRTQFYQQVLQHKVWLFRIILFGILVGLPANYFLARYMTLYNHDYFQLKTKGLYQTIAYALGVVPLAMAYVGILALLFQQAACNKILGWLAPVGKMAFSNYILQSLIGNFVFLGAGLGYMEKVGPVYYTLFGIAVFILQVIMSRLWLRYFNFGPIEWIWRSATYKQWQPFRKTA